MPTGSTETVALTLSVSEVASSTSAAIAAGATLFGFVLATARDLLGEHLERKRRRRAALRGFQREMASNRAACSSNLMMLNVEKDQLENRQSLGHVNPLDRLETGAWRITYPDLPSRLISNEDLLSRLQVLVRVVHQINSGIESRERFQIQHVARQDNFYIDGMLRYAHILRYPQEDLISRIDEAHCELSALLKKHRWLDNFRFQINRPPPKDGRSRLN
jgi:hypothetical protein